MGEVSAALSATILQEVVDRARLVPDRYRDYSTTWELATRHFRVPESLLARVLDFGFPHVRVDGQLQFDRKDLKNLLLRAFVPSPQFDAVKAIADTMNAAPVVPSFTQKISSSIVTLPSPLGSKLGQTLSVILPSAILTPTISSSMVTIPLSLQSPTHTRDALSLS